MVRVRPSVLVRALAAALIGVGAFSAAGQGPARAGEGKPGGLLRVMQREELPQGFAIHETATTSTVWPASPCFNNLVLFDPLKPLESADTIVGELAERWSWQDGYRSLAFVLRRDVRWHDGQPFTSRDVKHTFDMIREARDAAARLRLNPRKEWYANVEAIETPGPHSVVFRLKRPQPSLLAMLASGYSPVYPAHVPAAELRVRCVGTGPFRLKEWRKGEFVEYVRNPDYFVKGRPYLDGLRYVIIVERGTRIAAMQTGQVDVSYPADTNVAAMEQIRAVVPQMVFTETGTNVNDNLLMNLRRPPFDNLKVRRALSMAIDRAAYARAVGQGSAVPGASLAPRPHGVWGLLPKDLAVLPGYGKAGDEKARARALLAEAGFGPSNPLRVEMATRAIAVYLDFASFVVSELRQVGLDVTLKQVETAQWHALMTRREYQLAANRTGIGIDDPDASFYENYACGSPRNYTDYCDEQLMRLIDQQSQEIDPPRRQALVWQIQAKLEEDAARPIMGWATDRFAHRPHVRNLVPHQTVYSFGRMQEVWLEPR